MKPLDNHTRLFFSINLVNSTFFKQEEQRLGHKWQRDFLNFYYDFPKCLQAARFNYNSKRHNSERSGIPEFHFWKAIGDELLFITTITDYRQVKSAVDIWLDAQDSYENGTLKEAAVKFNTEKTVASSTGSGRDIQNIDASHKITRTRSAVFAATFHDPDVIVAIPKTPVETSHIDDYAPNNRKVIETIGSAGQQIRNDGEEYVIDYIGPSIDTGFHIIDKSLPDYFTMSVEVAWCYSIECKRIHDSASLHLVEQSCLKGVWSGRYYPIFAIYRGIKDAVSNELLMDYCSVTNICQACYDCEGWPSRLYLPDSPEEGEFASQIKKMKTPPVGGFVDSEANDDSFEDVKEKAASGELPKSYSEKMTKKQTMIAKELKKDSLDS